MPTPVILVAASGLAREVAAVLSLDPGYVLRGVLDDDPRLAGSVVAGATVLGPVESAGDHRDARFVLCAGRGASREAIRRGLAGLGVGPEHYLTVIHPSVEVPGSCEIGLGSVLLAQVALTADVKVGEHVVAMPNVTLTHDVVVEDFATLTAGVSLAGGVRVGRGAYLGMNASVRQGGRIGAGAVLGMGAVLLSDLPPGETWIGVPAQRAAHRPANGEAS